MQLGKTIAQYQPMLQALAQKIVRCKEDAEDIVQETFVKWLSAEQEKINNTKAYLIKAVTNNCLNHLNALKRKKNEYLDSFQLPEFFTNLKEAEFPSFDMDLHVSNAIRQLHLKLEPLERAVYLLKEVFNFDYDTLQQTLDRKKDHCRQLLCRAKKKLAAEKPTIYLEQPALDTFVESFKKACLGDVDDLVSNLRYQIVGNSHPAGK